MTRKNQATTWSRYFCASAVAIAMALGSSGSAADTNSPGEGGPYKILVADLPVIGRVDERFQAYNVESVEVTGGNFWAPYPEEGEKRASGDVGPHGVEFATGDYQKRTPIDLTNRRLITLTKALGPSYMRVSGSVRLR